jgi:4-amino-4-deoxy-L-arabinose transferase-like glycosyltransferase
MVARLAEALFGSSLVGLRLFAVLAGAGTIVVTAAIARQLGGRRWAQGIAALAAATPTLGSNANTSATLRTLATLAQPVPACSDPRVRRLASGPARSPRSQTRG